MYKLGPIKVLEIRLEGSYCMLSSIKLLKKYKLNSLDGEIGKVKDLYFDDQYWTIRYLVVETGSWLNNRKVLISTHFIDSINKEGGFISINLSKSQIENSPLLDSDMPVSRQYQERLSSYFDYPLYWGGILNKGIGFKVSGSLVPLPVIEDNEKANSIVDEEKWDANLRSFNYVRDYHIQTSDDSIGHINDFIIDDKTLKILYLVIDTHNWFPGKKVLISSQWIEKINWSKSIIVVNFTSEQIKHAQAYDKESSINRDYEIDLYKYYNQKGYWESPSEEE